MDDRVEAVLFDFGGVFTDSPFDAAESLGIELGIAPGRLVEIVFGPYHRDTDHPWHRLERGEISLRDARDEIIALGAREGVDSDPVALFQRMSGSPGTREIVVACVRRLRTDGYRTAVVTNNIREFREAWVRMVPVSELFDLVVDSSEVGVRKPDPRIFHLALEQLGGIAPERAVFLDDVAANVEAAIALGIRGVRVGADPAPALAELDGLLDGAGI